MLSGAIDHQEVRWVETHGLGQQLVGGKEKLSGCCVFNKVTGSKIAIVVMVVEVIFAIAISILVNFYFPDYSGFSWIGTVVVLLGTGMILCACCCLREEVLQKRPASGSVGVLPPSYVDL